MIIAIGKIFLSSYLIDRLIFWLRPANPVGAALGQLISPLVGDTRQSVRLTNLKEKIPFLHVWQILVLGVISTVVAPFVFLVRAAPPKPPSKTTNYPSLNNEFRLNLIRDASICGLDAFGTIVLPVTCHAGAKNIPECADEYTGAH